MGDDIVLSSDRAPIQHRPLPQWASEIETELFDSVTSFADMALQWRHPEKFGSSARRSWLQGYGLLCLGSFDDDEPQSSCL
jgi:hypothetical protein